MERNLEDWLEQYLNFSQNTECPRQYHLWTGISAIAACLQRKCWISWGHETIYPNLYIVLVGPPGGRKGTAMKILKPMLQDMNIIMSADSTGSVQSLYNEIREAQSSFLLEDGKSIEHRSLSTWSEELQVFLGDNDPKLVTNLTDLFDCPKKWSYKSLKQGTMDLSNCWLNILGGTTPGLLQSNLSHDAIGGGLISRIIFVVGYGLEKLVPMGMLSKEEIELQSLLAADLQQIYNLSGQFKLTPNFVDSYVDWYTSKCYTTGVDLEKFVGYNSRRALHLRKLCMIISASNSNNMIINRDHFNRALEVLEYTEQYMKDAFYGIGRGAHGEVITDIINLIKEEKSISWKNILKKFKLDMLPNDLNSCLESLCMSGLVKKEITPNNIMYTYVEEMEKEKILLEKSLFKYIK